MKGKLIVIGAAILIIAGVAALFIFGRPDPSQQLSGRLTFIGVFESPDVMNKLINAYRVINPKVEIEYVAADPVRYERDLLDALAGPNPPDVFMIHNAWLPKHFNKIFPFPSEQFSLNTLRQTYPTVVEQSFAPDGIVFALPLYIDTLATYYNQDIFDNKGVAVPPKTWKEFEALIPKLRELDKQGRILKAAAAIGGSNRSVNRGTDVLSLIMLQSGVKMVDGGFTAATFNQPPGPDAFRYYLKFANPLDPLYTWSESGAQSLDSFAAGETAIMFNYSHQAAFLKEKNPFLNFRVIPMLQPENRTQDVNYPSFWGVAVAANSRNRALAQNFIAFLAANPDSAITYLNETGRPPALRSLIGQTSNNANIGVFSRQALTARSWPQVDSAAVDAIFSNMIASVLTGQLPPDQAIQQAASSVSDLMRRRNL